MDRAKKECILTEAAKAFARFGFKKTSIDDIARDAGVGKGTVYLAANSKEDLYYQVLHRELREWISDCARAIDPRVPADQLLGGLLRVAMEYLEMRPLVGELLFGEAFRTMPGWADRLEELRTLGQANIAEVLRLGIRQGVFRPDLQIDTVAALLQDFHISAFLPGRKAPSKERMIEKAFVGLDLVLNGLRAHALPA